MYGALVTFDLPAELMTYQHKPLNTINRLHTHVTEQVV